MTDFLKLARACGATVYQNRHLPGEPAVAFGNEGWARFTAALTGLGTVRAIQQNKWERESLAALEQPQQEPLDADIAKILFDNVEKLYVEDEQPQQEPVAWLWQRQPKPVAYMNQHGVIHEADYEWGPNNDLTPLYAAPPQRKPLELSGIVRLTYAIDEDRPATQDELIAFARAIEAAHGIKGDA